MATSEAQKAAEKWAERYYMEPDYTIFSIKKAFLAGVAWREKNPKDVDLFLTIANSGQGMSYAALDLNRAYDEAYAPGNGWFCKKHNRKDCPECHKKWLDDRKKKGGRR